MSKRLANGGACGSPASERAKPACPVTPDGCVLSACGRRVERASERTVVPRACGRRPTLRVRHHAAAVRTPRKDSEQGERMCWWAVGALCAATRVFLLLEGFTIVLGSDAWLAGWNTPVPEPRVSLILRLPRWSGGAVCVRTLGVR